MSDLLDSLSKICLEKSAQQRHQEIRDIFEMMKIERRKYLQKRIILHAVSKCLTDDVPLNDELKNKTRSILLSKEVKPCMHLITRHSEEKLLGLIELDNIELSFNEQEKLDEFVKKKLKSLEENIASTNRRISDDDNDLFTLNVHDKVLFEIRRKVNDLQEMYMKNLQDLYDSLQDLLQLRFKDVKEILDHKINEYSIKSKMYSLRSQMLREKMKIDIFNESSISLQAYKELLIDITEQHKQCQKEIDDLNLLKEKYNFISSKEYDEILKLYLQYKNSVEKKKVLFNQVKEK